MNQSLIYRVLNVAELLPVDDSGTNWLMMIWTFFFLKFGEFFGSSGDDLF